MKYILAMVLLGLLSPAVLPTQAFAACTTVPCQKPLNKSNVVKEKYRCTVLEKSSRTHVPCPVKKKPNAVKEKYRCTVFDKASQSHIPCPVKKKPGVKSKYRCSVFDKDSQSHLPCEK